MQHLEVVPEAAPDLTRPDAGVPALTLFDREGWSPDLFKRLARVHHLAKDWNFRTLEVLIHGPVEPVPQPTNR